jgi:hypothetical protein
MAEDFWPDDLAEVNLITPAVILKEQAALLGEKTKQLVKGEVVTQASDKGFAHRFNIVAPTMNYTYELFTLSHGVAFYPGSFRVSGQSAFRTIESEEALKQLLKEVFSSQQTLTIVRSILAQVRS